jgi:hypothetical protein
MSDQGAYDRNQRAAEREHDLVIDRGTRLTEASTRDTQEAIKLDLLINSGAAVAILAFISTLASRSGISLANLKSVTNSPYWFTEGSVFAGLTAGFAYLSNSKYASFSLSIRYGNILI